MMSDIPQQYSDDDYKMPDSDGSTAVSQEDSENDRGRYEDSSSNAGDSESSVADLDPDLQAIKGLPVESRYHSTILIFHIDSMRKKSSNASTLKIRIPVLADKRKRSANESPQPSEGELEKRMPKKSKPSAQTPKKQGEKDTVTTKQAKKRGRPKGAANKTKKDSDFVAKKDFTVPVFLKIA